MSQEDTTKHTSIFVSVYLSCGAACAHGIPPILTMLSLDEDLLIAVLRLLDSDKTRASMACVCKTWRSCVKRSWDRVHIRIEYTEILRARINIQLQDHPLQLHSLALHSSSMPTPTFNASVMLRSVRIATETRRVL